MVLVQEHNLADAVHKIVPKQVKKYLYQQYKYVIYKLIPAK